MNDYYNAPSDPANYSVGRSSTIRAQFAGVAAGFDLLPSPSTINQGRPTWCLDTGTANAILLDMPVRPSSYQAGMSIRFKVAASNTGATTVNVMGASAIYLGLKNVLRADGTALEAGDLVANQVAEITYDGAAFRLAMAFAEMSPAGIAAKVALAGAITVNGALTATGSVGAGGALVITGAGALDSASVVLTKVDGGAFLNTPTGTSGLFAVGNVTVGTWSTTGIAVTGTITSTGGHGYATGAGGTVTQATSKSTTVTLNKLCGQITTHNAVIPAGGAVTFAVLNNKVSAGDVIAAQIVSGASDNTYDLTVTAALNGQFNLQLRNFTAGGVGEAIVIGFAVIKAVTS